MSGRNLSLILPFREKCGILLISVVILDKINRIIMAGVCFPSGMEEMGPVTKKLYETLTGIQMGRIEAPKGWIKVIE